MSTPLKPKLKQAKFDDMPAVTVYKEKLNQRPEGHTKKPDPPHMIQSNIISTTEGNLKLGTPPKSNRGSKKRKRKENDSSGSIEGLTVVVKKARVDQKVESPSPAFGNESRRVHEVKFTVIISEPLHFKSVGAADIPNGTDDEGRWTTNSNRKTSSGSKGETLKRSKRKEVRYKYRADRRREKKLKKLDQTRVVTDPQK